MRTRANGPDDHERPEPIAARARDGADMVHAPEPQRFAGATIAAPAAQSAGEAGACADADEQQGQRERDGQPGPAAEEPAAEPPEGVRILLLELRLRRLFGQSLRAASIANRERRLLAGV